jgi:DNA invertase Pin-like site-specific DNA recombinase
MSTDRQEYSIAFQTATNAAHAIEHGYELVRTYADEGVSGLGIEKREGLKRLLADVVSGASDFSVILVYDVSRWGRFQNPDQAAHYEFICKEAGVAVEYCAEPFANDDSLATVIMKSIRRAMAAEFSRDLSAKVRWGREKAGALGFWVGGPPGYGYRRQLVRQRGRTGPTLERGEYKAFGTGWRVILIPGPAHEIATVRRIYRLYLKHLGVRDIARLLNNEGVSMQGAPWNESRVREVLRNEKYIGNRTTGTGSQALGGRCVHFPRSQWKTQRGTHQGIVSVTLFRAVQKERARRKPDGWSDEELLRALRRLLAKHGYLSERLMFASPEMPRRATYVRRFGSLMMAFRRAGYEPSRMALLMSERARRITKRKAEGGGPLSREEMIAAARRLLEREGRISRSLIRTDPDCLDPSTYVYWFGSMARLYELLGYKPDAHQRAAINKPAPSDRSPSITKVFGKNGARR